MKRAKLTKAERAHRRECAVTTVIALTEAIQHQRHTGARCWECEAIARKLGLVVSR